jgi:hypothetical protein
MTVFVVTLRNAVGRERTERVVASTETSACNQAVLRVTRETGQNDWQVALVLPL